MNVQKKWKVIILLAALVTQAFVMNLLVSDCSDNTIWQIAGEVPEPGSILLFAIGGLLLRRQIRKNRR